MNPAIPKRLTRTTSRVAYGTCIGFTVLILGILALVTGYLVTIGIGSISWSFFAEVPTGDPSNPGGMKHAIVGTLILIGAASLFGIPIGMLAGVYLAEYEANSVLAGPVRFVADVLAGVPSIVVGILGYELLVVPFSSGEILGVSIPWLKTLSIHGYNGWAGAAALAFIMVPIVARTTEEMLRLVPNSYREASIALGATKARTILRVVIPAASGSVVTGIMLAVARIAGETAPLLFTALGSRLMTYDPRQPFPSLTVQIFTYATGPYPQLKAQAWAGILVLIAIVFVLNVGVRVAARSRAIGVK